MRLKARPRRPTSSREWTEMERSSSPWLTASAASVSCRRERVSRVVSSAVAVTAASAATIAAMEADTVGIVNLVAAMYLDLSTPRLEVILRRQITFSTTEPDEVYYGCPINQENGGGCVGTWSTWWKDFHKNNSIPNDAMHVLTGRYVSGYLGVAGVRVTCSAHHSGSGLTSTTMKRDDVEYLQTQFDTAWNLPPLTTDALVELLVRELIQMSTTAR